MTTTPDLLRDDAARGVDARNATFIARAGAAVRSVVEDLVAKTGGSLGVTLETLTPGPALAALLADLDPARLTPAQQVSFLLATERLTAWVGSLQNTGLVAFSGAAPTATQYTVDGRAGILLDARRTEIAGHLLWSEGIARGRVATARALAADLPQTREALAAGAVSVTRAMVIAEGAHNLTSGIDTLLEHSTDGVERVELHALRSEMLAAFEGRVTEYAATHNTGRTRGHVTRTIARLDPAGWAARRQRAIREQSNVTLRHLTDGLSELTAVMATEHAITCAQTIEARARALQTADPTSRIGLHRTTAMLQLLTDGHASAEATTGTRHDATGVGAQPDTCAADTADEARHSARHDVTTSSADAAAANRPTLPTSPRLHLNVTIDLPTLLALREGVGEIDGAGPIPASTVRELVAAGGAAIRWLTTNQAGDPISASPGYRIPDPLRTLIVSRDRTCAMPNCSTPAVACEIDHIQPWDTGGSTTPENLQALCKRHHQTKTHSTPVRALTQRQRELSPEPGVGSSTTAVGGVAHAETHAVHAAIDTGTAAAAHHDNDRRTPLTGHPLAGLASLHARLAPLQQQLEELTDLSLTDAALQTRITDLDARAVTLFDDTLDACLTDAFPAIREAGVINVMLRHELQRHHHRTCRPIGSSPTHSMQHCPQFTHQPDTPPF